VEIRKISKDDVVFVDNTKPIDIIAKEPVLETIDTKAADDDLHSSIKKYIEEHYSEPGFLEKFWFVLKNIPAGLHLLYLLVKLFVMFKNSINRMRGKNGINS